MKFVTDETYKDIAVAFILIIPVLFACYIHRNGEKIEAILRNTITPQSYAYEYKEPPLATPNEQEEVKALIKRIWGYDYKIGLLIARCESGYRHDAYHNNSNNTQDQGIFQINTIHKMPDMFNPTANIAYAYTKYLEQGTTPWNSSQSCWNNPVIRNNY